LIVRSARKELWGTAIASSEWIRALGFSSHMEDILIRAPRPTTGRQRAELDALSRKLAEGEIRTRIEGTADGFAYLTYLRPAPSTNRVRVVFISLSFLFTLGVIALGLALASADGSGERALLGALGAPPAWSRRVAVVQSASLAALGGLLAVPVGFGPAAAVLASGESPTPIVFPWATLVALVGAVPLAVALLTAVGSRLARRPLSAAALAAD
ncbi:MAG: hypothetical protein ACRDJM_04070, partial [Actinomycetota bacterium]